MVDEDEGCQSRIIAEKENIETNLKMNIVTLSKDLKQEIAALPATRPSQSYRENVKADTPIGLFYTRYFRHPYPPLDPPTMSNRSLAGRPVYPKPAPSPHPDSSFRLPFAVASTARPPAHKATLGTIACPFTTARVASPPSSTSSRV